MFSGRVSDETAWKRAFLFMILHLPMVYINMELLIPRLYLKKKYLLYALACIAILIALFFLFKYIWHLPLDEIPQRPRRVRTFGYRGLFDSFLGIVLLLLSSIVKLAQVSNQKEKETAQLRSENLNSELKFLKSQINPHFLFNTLNNIYTLSLLKSDKTPDTVLKLSEMLRYVLYECSNKERVPVSKEVVYIQNYIALQLLKDSAITNVEFISNIERDAGITPMLFIPFVENAFKHSRIEDVREGWIRIQLNATQSAVTFTVENSLPDIDSTKDETGGIGIENVKKRLILTYPGQHSLEVTKRDKSFVIHLEITLP